PSERVLPMHGAQVLRVVARFSDGHETDVTRHARFQSNNDGLAVVSASGNVTTFDVPGEVAIMASYLGQVDVFRAIIPREGAKPQAAVSEFNFIDQLVDQKLAKLNIQPSELCDDAEYLRRVYLDLIGTLPTPAEARQFLADNAKDKRAKLAAGLLE